jgi:hypothetical protein
VERESIMVGGLLLPSRVAATVSLPFVAAERVEPMRGASIKVTDKGRGRREVGKVRTAAVTLMFAAVSEDEEETWRERPLCCVEGTPGNGSRGTDVYVTTSHVQRI